jgi:GT2 family glycosyltransferase
MRLLQRAPHYHGVVPLLQQPPVPLLSPHPRQVTFPYVATIAIVSYRTPELAQECADSIDIGGLKADVRIVETGETSNLEDGLRPPRYYMPGAGYSAALQAVFRGSEAPVLIACNADVEFPSSSIEQLLELLLIEPDVALIGPRQANLEGRIVHAGIMEPGSTFGGRDYGQIDQGQHVEPLLDVPQVSGSVMLIRREAFEEIGGMTNMPRLYFEDALLCLRLRRAGWRVCYSGLQTFTHHVAASPAPMSASRAELAREGSQRFMAEFATVPGG